MKVRNERVSRESLQELESFVNSLDVNILDKEIVEKLAIDIFPLLPEVSIAGGQVRLSPTHIRGGLA